MAADLEHARDLIELGMVLVDGSIQQSHRSFIDPASSIEFQKDKPRYVSRGGLKLQAALEKFAVDPSGWRCLDVGASTGGFTDCLLQHGASHVIAVDVGHGQIDLSLREDPRVDVLERTNAKNLSHSEIGGTCEFGVMDVSFTSVIPIINPVVKCLDPVNLVVLIKPQFECQPQHVNSRGIVTDPDARNDCIKRIRDSLDPHLKMIDLIVSPIKGSKGNLEYLAHIVSSNDDTQVIQDSMIWEIATCDLKSLEDEEV